jgi:cytochrome P450 family 6
MARYTTDVIGSCAFGINVNSIEDPNDKFRVMGRKMLEVDFIQGLKNACIIFTPRVKDQIEQKSDKLKCFQFQLAKLLNLKFFPDDVCDFFRQLVNDIVALRIKDGNTRKDFMQLLVELKQSGKVSADDCDTVETETEEDPSSTTRNLLEVFIQQLIGKSVFYQDLMMRILLRKLCCSSLPGLKPHLRR